MSVNIQELLGTLFQDLAVTNDNLLQNTKIEIAQAQQHFLKLQKSDLDQKQTKMIRLFLGSLIYALYIQGWKPEQINSLIDYSHSSNSERFEATGGKVLAALSEPETREDLMDLFLTIIFTSDKKLQNQIKYLMEFCALNPDNLEKPTFTPTNYQEEVEENFCNMAVLTGFILALGLTAVAIGFVVLINISTLGGGLLLGAGIGALLIGQGLFSLKDKELPSLKKLYTNPYLEERIINLEEQISNLEGVVSHDCQY